MSEWRPYIANIVCENWLFFLKFRKIVTKTRFCQRDCFGLVPQIEPHPTSWQYPLINYLDMDEIGELRFSVKLVFLLPGTHTRSKTLFSFSSSSLQSLVTWLTSRPRAIHKLHHLRGVNRETNYPVAIVLLQANYLSLKKNLICIMSSCIQTRAGRPFFT